MPEPKRRSETSCPLLSLLTRSPWPLNVPDIARVLEIDEITAAMALKLLRDAGLAHFSGTGWTIK